MDIPIAFPIAEYEFPKYTLEENLRLAEYKLKQVLDESGLFFATVVERDETIQRIRENPTEVYARPFLNKIAKGFLDVAQCKEELECADMSLTPAQVKKWETKISGNDRELDCLRVQVEQMNIQLQHLRQELEVERIQRRAFQSKVKNFSEDVRQHAIRTERLVKYGGDPKKAPKSIEIDTDL